MKATDAHIGLQDPSTEIRNQLRPNLPDLLVVVLVWLECIKVQLRDFGLRETRCSLEPVPGLNRVDARDDGNCDSRRANLLDPLNEHIDVVEHLCEDKVHARVDLLLEELHLTSALFGWQELVLRETSDGDVEVITVLFTNVADQVDTMSKPTIDGLPFVLALWWVTAKGEDISAAELFSVLTEGSVGNFSRGSHETGMGEESRTHPESNVDLLLRHVRAREVHACLDADQALACLHQLGGKVGRPSTSVPALSFV